MITFVKIGDQKAKIETSRNGFTKEVECVFSFQKEPVTGLFTTDRTKPVKCLHSSYPSRITQKQLEKIHALCIESLRQIYDFEVC